jgi:Methylase involved in ubiquinone/menaquinone biosynthesis
VFDARTNYRRSGPHASLAAELLRLALPQPDERVLDIATGTGFVAVQAARLVGSRGSVLGVDLSPGMLRQAREAIAEAGLDNLALVQADAEELGLLDDEFDLATCCNALPYMTHVAAALQHWLAFLRPGGRLVFNCWAENSHATGHLLRRLAARHGIRVAPVGIDTGTPARCRRLLSDIGFRDVEVVEKPTAAFISASTVEGVFDSFLDNPLYEVSRSDADRLRALRDEYVAQARSARVRQEIEAERGAYFVLARKPGRSSFTG